MKTRFYTTYIFLLVSLLLLNSQWVQAQSVVPTPESFFGFKPGADRMLFNYERLIDYLRQLDEISPRLKMVPIGKSPLGKPMYVACFSAAENIDNLNRLKTINKRLALEPDIPDMERRRLIHEGRVFVIATLSMHSGEVAPSQAAPLIAYHLVTTTDPNEVKQLQQVVYLMVPNHNPDGMDMIVSHYQRYKGSKWEDSSMPGVYHKYVGHDNNRDFVILSQQDTKAISYLFSHDWFPQVMVEKHQMGSLSARYYVPPPHDPIAENVDEELWNWVSIFGANLITDMTQQGLAGISQHYIFDDYWPGSTETCLWKGVIAFLTEAASVKYATPVYVEPNELNAFGKGLSEYKKSINMPLPWPGGWWRLGDIVRYELASTYSILKTAALHKEAILRFRNDLCRKEVKKGQSEPPYYYILPRQQHDPGELVNLVRLLQEHGISVYRLQKPVETSSLHARVGDLVVPLAQPFRSFIKEIMERQYYPIRHYTPDGEIIKPYDITSWSLPLHRGIKALEIDRRIRPLETSIVLLSDPFCPEQSAGTSERPLLFSVNENESYKAAFLAVKWGLKVERLKEAVNIDDHPFPTGSFLIHIPAEKRNKLTEAVSATPVALPSSSQPVTEPFRVPRIALVETYFHDMDAGWTRFIFDTYSIPFTIVRPGDFEHTNFSKRFDVVIFPDANKDVLMTGKYKSRDNTYNISSYPPEYTKGIGKDGMKRLMTFLDAGGLIVSWGRSTALFSGTLSIQHGKETEEFQLPFQDQSQALKKKGLYCPGSLVNILIRQEHPLTLGMPSKIGVFYRGRPVFRTSIPRFDTDRRVLGLFPERHILASGYCEHDELLANASAMIWMRKGKGQLVLFAFQPQFRASTQAAYKLMFNALLLPQR